MSHDHGQVCRCVAEHRPPPLELEQHHVWPLGMGGPDIASNRVWICPTTHTNVHEVLRLLMKYGPLTYREVQQNDPDRPLSHYAYGLAVRGYQAWKEGAQTWLMT